MSSLVLEETLKYHAGHLATDPSSVDIFCEKVYGGERRWLAGCLLLTGGADPTFQLRPLNVFFTEKPDEEVGIVSIIRELHNNSFPPRCQICVWRLLDSLRRVSLFTFRLLGLCIQVICFRSRMGRSVRERSPESHPSREVWQNRLQLARLLHQQVQEP